MSAQDEKPVTHDIVKQRRRRCKLCPRKYDRKATLTSLKCKNDLRISVSHFVNNRLKQCFVLTLHESFCNRNSRHVYLKHTKKQTQIDLNLNSGSLESLTFLYLLCFGCFK